MRTYTIEVEVEDPDHNLNTEYVSGLATMAARVVQVALGDDGNSDLDVTGVRVSRYTESEVHARGGHVQIEDVPVPCGHENCPHHGPDGSPS
jgi:hypothetical protein